MGTYRHAVYDSRSHHRYRSLTCPYRYHSLESRLYLILRIDGIVRYVR